MEKVKSILIENDKVFVPTENGNVEVSNVNYFKTLYVANVARIGSSPDLVDGLYPVSGMVMEMKEQVTVKGQNNWYDIPENNCYDGTYEYEFRKVCTISLEPVEEKKLTEEEFVKLALDALDKRFKEDPDCTKPVGYSNPYGNLKDLVEAKRKEIETPYDHLPDDRKEPDFEGMALKWAESACQNRAHLTEHYAKGYECGMYRIWKEHVIPAIEGQRLAIEGGNKLAKKYREAQEEITRLNEKISNLSENNGK